MGNTEMDEKTYNVLKEKALELYKDCGDLTEHVKKVEEISRMLCDIAGIKDKNKKHIVSLGAILHDVCKPENKNSAIDDKYKDKDKHHKCGKKFLKKYFFKNPNGYDEKIILAIVRYHKGKLKKNDTVSIDDKQLVVIVRVADKISKIYKLQKYFNELQEVCETTVGIEKLKKKYEDITDDLDKAMKEISKFMKEGNENENQN